jgi:hypothetical protein
MLRKIIIALSSLAMVAAAIAVPTPAPAQAQGDSGLRLVSEFLVPNSRNVKYPHVAASRGQVTVSGNINRDKAVVWTKAAAATAFPDPFELGEADGTPDYSSTAVTYGSDGSLYVAWANQPARQILMRSRNPQGAWGPLRVLESGTPFGINPEIAVTTSGQIFVAWREVDRPLRFRFSSDGGNTWSSRRDVSDKMALKGAFGMAAGPGGRLGVVFNAAEGDLYQIFVSLWNGNNFVTTRVTATNDNYADPTITFAPSGQAYVAWRGVATSGGNAGAFFAEQQADGSWPRSRLIGGAIFDNVNISSDEQGNIHMAWVGTAAGAPTVYYAFKPAGAAFRGPLASSDTGALYSARLAASVADTPFGHVVNEEFSGSSLFTRYSLFNANAVTFGGEPVVENGSARVAPASDGTVALTFRSLAGNPDQVRWRWEGPPSDTANDSGGWQALSPVTRVPVPNAIRNNTSCRPVTLFTQLRNSTTGVVEPQPRSLQVNLDGIVEAIVYLDNPFAKATAGEIQEGAPLNVVAGAPGGAPNYTRVPLTWLTVFADTDCSGITVAEVGPTADKVEQTFVINDGVFSGLVALPNLANLKPGPVPFVVRVRDGAGNLRLYNFEVIFDETKPVYRSGSFTASADEDGDVLQNLTFSNVVIEDQYPGGYWGVWIANSPDAVSDPANAQNLNWTVVEVPAEDRSDNGFVIPEWSLATGLQGDQLRAGGDYYIYVRFLDGAGNPTDEVISTSIESVQLLRPEVELPLVRR